VAALLLVAFGSLGFVAWEHFREQPPRLVKFSFPPPEKGAFLPAVPSIAVSPDGQRIAYEARVNRRELWVRDLDNVTSRMLAPIAALGGILPFWAPDGHRLAFFDGTKLKEIDVNGGPSRTLADIPSDSLGSGSWNRDGVIIFGRLNSPLFRIPETGGSPAPLTELDKARGEISHWAPWFLPDGRHYVYVALTDDPEKGAVYVGDLGSKTRAQVFPFATRVIYVNPGYLLYVRGRTLMAQPFDIGKLVTTGDAISIVDGIDASTVGWTLGHFSASHNGVLAYTAGSPTGDSQLTWFDRTGKKLGVAGAPGFLREFSLSPDDSAVAFVRQEPQVRGSDVYKLDLAGGQESRLTSAGNNSFPVWSYDGTHIYFAGSRDGTSRVYWKAANGTGPEEVVVASALLPWDASSDYLLATTPPDSKGGRDICVLPLSRDRKPPACVATEFDETRPKLSPNGQWLAYQSNELKRSEIYVVSFPIPDKKSTISTDGGGVPVWSSDGRELYYYSSDGKITAVEIKPGSGFQHGPPKALFPVRITNRNASFSVSKDGHFLVAALVEQEASTPMTVVLNWPELLKKK
jgi:Tol biopolymer transport system component